jgi:probable HAF family extracellular repeat protein
LHGFTWTKTGGMTDLTLGGPSRTSAVNDFGQVVGASATAGGANHAYSWTPGGGIVDIGTLGGSASIAYGVNRWGQVVGQAALPNDTKSHAFLFDNGALKDLNDFTPNKPTGLELLSAMLPADNRAMVAVTNTGFALLTPASATPTAPPSLRPSRPTIRWRSARRFR